MADQFSGGNQELPSERRATEGLYTMDQMRDYADAFHRSRTEAEAAGKRGVSDASVPKLSVWYGKMPESNGKTNWTAILHRGGVWTGITIDRSEYPDRVRYEADRMRWMIGDIDKEPCILDYDADKHSGYLAPSATVDVAESGEAVAEIVALFAGTPAGMGRNTIKSLVHNLGAFPRGTKLYAAPVSAAAGVASVPEGYALVPLVPTEKMVDAGIAQRLDILDIRAGRRPAPYIETSLTYRGMLAAAPTPTAPDDVARIYLGRLRNGSTTWLEFTMEAWEKLDASWERAIGATQENHHGE